MWRSLPFQSRVKLHKHAAAEPQNGLFAMANLCTHTTLLPPDFPASFTRFFRTHANQLSIVVERSLESPLFQC